MKIRKLFYVLAFFIVVSIYHSGEVFAADEKEHLGYTVSMVQPKTQIDPKRSYFYIQTRPNEPQNIEVRIKSTKKEAVKIKIFSQNAITGNNGTIDYTEELADKDASLTSPITEMVKVETPEVTVENFEEKTVKITIMPPKESYKGVKMGALVFALDQGQEAKNGVATEFSYRIGLITSESGDEFTNGETLNLTEAKASIKRGKKMVLATLQNPEPKTVEGLTVSAELTKKNSEKVIKKKNVKNYAMAPNSHVDFEIDWGTNTLPSGKYMITLAIHSDYQEWYLQKEFTITNQQAKTINKESAFKIITPKWGQLTAIALLFFTLINSCWLMARRRKWEMEWEKLRRAKKRERLNKKNHKAKSQR
ncbi:Fe-S cluster assembly iron-binding protein IscA [Enterococcus rotai]|nr:DUF916 and DUF3324 domain-containing protein [Enterococcus rotai]